MTIEEIKAYIERRKEALKPHGGQGIVVTKLMRELCDDFLSFIDSKKEESINDSDISCDAELCFAHTGCKYYNPNKKSNVNHCIGGLPLQLMQIKQKTTTSVWHDANTLPSDPKAVIVEHNEYSTSICRAEQMSRVKGAKWAYIEDLLKL